MKKWEVRESVLKEIHNLIQNKNEPITFTPNYLAKTLNMRLSDFIDIVFSLVREEILMMEISFPCEKCNATVLNFFHNEFSKLRPVNIEYCNYCDLKQKFDLKNGLVFLHIRPDYIKHIKAQI